VICVTIKQSYNRVLLLMAPHEYEHKPSKEHCGLSFADMTNGCIEHYWGTGHEKARTLSKRLGILGEGGILEQPTAPKKQRAWDWATKMAKRMAKESMKEAHARKGKEQPSSNLAARLLRSSLKKQTTMMGTCLRQWGRSHSCLVERKSCWRSAKYTTR
jgi:hypothetical protein